MGRLPLHIAAACGEVSLNVVTQLLLSFPEARLAVDGNGLTPIDCMIDMDSQDVPAVRTLLGHDDDAEAVDPTPVPISTPNSVRSLATIRSPDAGAPSHRFSGVLKRWGLPSCDSGKRSDAAPGGLLESVPEFATTATGHASGTHSEPVSPPTLPGSYSDKASSSARSGFVESHRPKPSRSRSALSGSEPEDAAPLPVSTSAVPRRAQFGSSSRTASVRTLDALALHRLLAEQDRTELTTDEVRVPPLTRVGSVGCGLWMKRDAYLLAAS